MMPSTPFIRLVKGMLPTQAELNSWLLTLAISPAKREALRALGPLANWTDTAYCWSFREYVTERRAVLMVDYMAEHLNGGDFVAWVDFVEQGEGKRCCACWLTALSRGQPQTKGISARLRLA